MPSPRTVYQMRVHSLTDRTPTVRELIVKCETPPEFQFRAGQFVMLHVPDGEKPALRAYSIASSEQDRSGFRLLFKYVPQGKASEFVWSLRGGETLQFTGPFGRVFFAEPPTEQVVFLNTGTGVSQHYSYLVSKIKAFPNLRYRLFFGVRQEEDIYFESELKELKNELRDFEFEYVLSRPSADWKGRRGYVQQCLEELDFMKTPTTFYLCGNGGMIKDTKEILSSAGFDPKKIFAEAFD